MSIVNLFYASDKAVYDALLQHRFTKSDLNDLFLSRGILLSNETKRDSIAKYFSGLNHDYYDHQAIATALGVAHRKEKTSITSVNNDISEDVIESVSLDLKKEYEQLGALVSFHKKEKGSELKLIYTKIDYNKSEFKQVIEREAVINFESHDKQLTIRWPHNEYINEVKERFLDLLNTCDEIDEDINIEEIELSSIEHPNLRTEFFVKLLESMDGLHMYDVTDVQVYHPKLEDEEDNEGVHIFKAALKGEGVHISEELKSLYKKGFYLSKITWVARTDDYESDLYELEAQFMDSEQCKDFSYLVKGVYKYYEKGDHVKTRTSLSHFDEIRLGRLIENSARKSKSLIEKKTQE